MIGIERRRVAPALQVKRRYPVRRVPRSFEGWHPCDLAAGAQGGADLLFLSLPPIAPYTNDADGRGPEVGRLDNQRLPNLDQQQPIADARRLSSKTSSHWCNRLLDAGAREQIDQAFSKIRRASSAT